MCTLIENGKLNFPFISFSFCRAKVICAWGAEGVVAIDNDSDTFYTASAYPPEVVVDSLGAGDTFVAATIHYLAIGKSLQASIDFACCVAGAKVGFFGYDRIKETFAPGSNH